MPATAGHRTGEDEHAELHANDIDAEVIGPVRIVTDQAQRIAERRLPYLTHDQDTDDEDASREDIKRPPLLRSMPKNGGRGMPPRNPHRRRSG